MIFSIPNLLLECTYKNSRSSGKGGQHVNKTESRVSLFFNIRLSEVLTDDQKEMALLYFKTKLSNDGVLQIDVEESRSQLKNKKIAQERIISLIEKSLIVKKKRKVSKPTKAAIKMRLKNKKRLKEKKSQRKKDFL